MSANFNTRIVTNGLVIYLDAANKKSHPKTGDTWYNLISTGSAYSNNLINSPSYSNSNLGSVQFNASSSQYARAEYLTPLNDFTACAWFKSTGTPKNLERILDKHLGSGFWIGRNAATANSWGGGVREDTSPYGRFVTLNDGEWHYIVSRRSGSNHTISGNGGAVTTTSGGISTNEVGDADLRMGIDHRESTGEGNVIFTGNIAVVQLYNRALTDEEIKQNFNAHRGRFGK